MYSGIIQTLAQIVDLHSVDRALDLTVQVNADYLDQVKIGASIALDGICMTVVKKTANTVSFNAIEATIAASNIGDRSVNDLLNFERSLRLGDENGGHPISGHVYGVGHITQLTPVGRGAHIVIAVPSHLIGFIFPKGFIAIDGASLTVGNVDEKKSTIELNLIPETLNKTAFSSRGENARVNIEVDYQTMVLVQSIERALRRVSA